MRWALLAGLALAVRLAAAWWLGPGPFGPDGPGAQAAAVLGGHPYPLHPLAIGLVGARGVSLVAGTVTVLACAALGERWGRRFWGPGLAAACAPLLVYPSALAGGDALAVALAAVGLALAARGRGLSGGFLAAASLWAKPIALPLMPLLVLTPAPALAALGAGLGLGLSSALLQPLLSPKPRAGLLGSWWASTDGLVATPGQLPELLIAGVERLWELPLWTGHPVLGGLAVIGVLATGRGRRRRALIGLGAAACLVATAAVLGDVLRPRYLGAASVPLTVLAGLALGRVPWLALGLLWPTLALVSQVAAVRTTDDDLAARPVLTTPPVDAQAEFMDAGVCGGTELRELAAGLASTLPTGAEVVALRLRDGRQNDLLWPLQAARPDLRLTVFHQGCCGGLDPVDCAAALRHHLDSGGSLVAPLPAAACRTPLTDPGESLLVAPLAPHLAPGLRHGRLDRPGPGRRVDACQAIPGEKRR